MSGINSVLDIGKSALLTHQLGIHISGHNIANVNTPGYSRQVLHLETKEPMSFTPGMLGMGVRGSEVRRIHDSYLLGQLNSEYQALGRWDAESGVLERLEMILSADEFNNSLCEFWNAWEDLANNPSGLAERAVVISRGEQVVNIIQRIHSSIMQFKNAEVGAGVTATVEEINLLSEQIADLNKKIISAEAVGQNANDFRDKQELLVRELSEKIDIDYFYDNEGQLNIIVCGMKPLVNGGNYFELSTQTREGVQEVLWIDSEGESTVINQNISGGSIKGNLVDLKSYIDRFDELAKNIIECVNSIHSAGFGLDGSTGIDFFIGSSASGISVNPALVNDLNMIAASGTYEGLPGDNGNALAIADLRYDSSIGDYFNSIVNDVGANLQKANSNAAHQSEMIVYMNNLRESVSGVSLDEEMISLIQYQHAYQSAAKLVAVADELLRTVINMV
ncbi:MAG: flagellar hook-associated protein FlgK [Deltaproteobacteria bacterium]|nr:flagellar hook-associated protein FlgK [Deltaproteobacteria bacterium]